jgi:hypothetical protein
MAQRLGPAVEPSVASARAAELRTIADAKAAAHREAREGTTSDIVSLRRAKGKWEGVTEDYLTVVTPTAHVGRRFTGRLVNRGGVLEAEPVD